VNIGAWLQGLGMGRYEQAFRDNDIGPDVLPALTAEDLKDIGVTSVGDRRRLLGAIGALRGEAVGAAQETAVPPPPRSETAPPVETGAAERRQVTVLFCDLAGSTALSARLDPEDLREVMAAYRRAVTEAVRCQGGYVAKLLGDGVLAYFGWPQAHEDDAERAVRTGLAAVEAVVGLQTTAGPLSARVGIATGPVVVGDLLGEGEAQERGVVGETPNLAARLQTLAEPGAVVIDAATRRLTGALFECTELAEVELKGLPHPLRSCRVLCESRIESRFEALHTSGGVAAPLVGREEELELLLRRWRRAAAGEGQVVLLAGEPGIGKSRLIAALQNAASVTGTPHERLDWFCAPHQADSTLRPVITRIERAAGFATGDAPEVRLAKLEAMLMPGAPSAEDVALLAELLGVATCGRYPIQDLSPQRRRERLLQAMLHRMQTIARRQPVLAVLEDAHWIDPTTRELLDLLVAEAPSLPLLLIVTHRPEFATGAWTGQPHVTEVRLNRLGRRDNAALVQSVAQGKALPREILEQILARTDGVPLFVEELTRAVLEGGLLREEADRYALDGPVPAFAVPTTLQASLVARLDRLSTVREIAQAGAAIGREFPHDLLAVVTGLSEDALRNALVLLIASDLVTARGAPPEALYTFKHALVRDAAYETLLRERRRTLHAHIAQAIERLRPEAAVREPQLLAHHWMEAGAADRAIAYNLNAAELALTRAALTEAEAVLRRSFTLLKGVADETERVRAELDLQLLLAKTFGVARGYAAPETDEAFARALELSEKAADPDRRYRALAGRWAVSFVRAEPGVALEAALELVREAHLRGDTGAEQGARTEAGYTLLVLGRPIQARSQLEAALALGEPPPAWRFAYLGQSAPVAAQLYLAFASMQSGEPDRAVSQSRAALAAARSLGHAFTLANTFSGAIRFSIWVRDEAAAKDLIDEFVAFSEEKGFPHYRAIGSIYCGWRAVLDGHGEEGAATVRAGIDAYRDTGARLNIPAYLGIQALAYMSAGQTSAGLAVVAEALQLAEAGEEREYEAELWRLRGMLQQGRNADAAEANLRRALAVARGQEAHWWELRAATSLARHWRDQGRLAEAKQLLAPVYSTFSEGFGLPSLIEAKALLNE
jgi:class 3 adenylate cyclase